MADKTFGVKVSEELHDKVKQMIENSGDSAKDWFEKAVALSELQYVKQGATDYSQDLNELEVHTTRIYELISNMVQRSIYLKDSAVKEVADKLQKKEAIIGEYQERTKVAIEELKQSKESVKGFEKEKEEALKQLEELRSTNENNQLLINEYKKNTDNLSSLVSKYQAYADENEQLKEQFSYEREQLQSQIKEVTEQTDDQQDEIKDLKQQIESLQERHIVDVERLTEKKDYEKDKALLDLEREYQQKLLQSNEEYTNQIKELYKEMDNLRKENENVRKEYERKLEQLQQTQAKQAPKTTNNRNQK